MVSDVMMTDAEDTIQVVEVQILKYGRVQSFDPNDLALQKGDRVLVESELGLSFGVVCTDAKPVFRLAKTSEKGDSCGE